MADHKAIIDKVRKLLAKAMGTENEHEAMAFADAAQTMLAAHNLTTADLEEVRDFVVMDAPIAPDWEQRVNIAVAKLYFCKYFIAWVGIGDKQQALHSFVGEEHNVKVAKMMADYIIAAINRMAKPGIDARRGKGEGPGHYMRSFGHQASIGVAVRIKNRILASMANGITEEGTTLPALRSLYDQSQEELEAFLGKQFGTAGRAGLPQLDRHDPVGLDDGERAGEAIGLDQQVAGTAAPKGLLQ